MEILSLACLCAYPSFGERRVPIGVTFIFSCVSVFLLFIFIHLIAIVIIIDRCLLICCRYVLWAGKVNIVHANYYRQYFDDHALFNLATFSNLTVVLTMNCNRTWYLHFFAAVETFSALIETLESSRLAM